MNNIDDLLEELDAVGRLDRKPFPYHGCHWLNRQLAVGRNIVPDLDSYLSELAGYRSWGRRILTWSDETVATVRDRLRQSFFERFPVYAGLEASLGAASASDVKQALDAADRTRRVLDKLLAEIQAGNR